MKNGSAPMIRPEPTRLAIHPGISKRFASTVGRIRQAADRNTLQATARQATPVTKKGAAAKSLPRRQRAVRSTEDQNQKAPRAEALSPRSPTAAAARVLVVKSDRKDS